MAQLTQPHDKFFKGLLDQPGTAGALLRERLPDSIRDLLTDDPPELEPGEYIDEALRDSHSDRLYRARLRDGGEILFYVLIDHKSTPEESIILQLLGYLLRIWIRRAAGKAEALRNLPPIVPLVVYHGAQEWTVSLSLREMIAAPDVIRDLQPDFRYVLVDLGPIPDPELSAYPPLRAGLLVLKYSHRNCDHEAVLVQAYADAKDEPALFAMLTMYATTVFSDVNAEGLRRAIRTVRPEWEEAMLSIAAREWRAEGEAKGKAEGKAEMLIEMCELRFGPLSPENHDRVRGADSSQLHEWSRRFVNARTLAEVFEPKTEH